MKSMPPHRPMLIAAAATALVAMLAVAPGSWSTALAQTAGTPTPAATTAPDGSVTTTTTLPGGGTRTETVKPSGETVTVTALPGGTTTTVVDVPNQGVVTVVEVPGEPIQIAVAPDNPNTDTSLQVEVLSASLDIPAGTLSPGEVISIVEQSFAFAIVLGIEDASRAAGGSTVSEISATGDLATAFQALQAEPGSITAVRVFEMTVQKPSGATETLATPIQMTWDFSPEDFAAAGGNFANLLMIGYDEATQKWKPATQVETTSTSATFEVANYTLWAFAVRNAPILDAPVPANTGAGPGADSSASGGGPVGMAAAVLGLALLAGAAHRLTRRRA